MYLVVVEADGHCSWMSGIRSMRAGNGRGIGGWLLPLRIGFAGAMMRAFICGLFYLWEVRVVIDIQSRVVEDVVALRLRLTGLGIRHTAIGQSEEQESIEATIYWRWALYNK